MTRNRGYDSLGCRLQCALEACQVKCAALWVLVEGGDDDDAGGVVARCSDVGAAATV